jgi:hypothetical protein
MDFNELPVIIRSNVEFAPFPVPPLKRGLAAFPGLRPFLTFEFVALKRIPASPS